MPIKSMNLGSWILTKLYKWSLSEISVIALLIRRSRHRRRLGARIPVGVEFARCELLEKRWVFDTIMGTIIASGSPGANGTTYQYFAPGFNDGWAINYQTFEQIRLNTYMRAPETVVIQGSDGSGIYYRGAGLPGLQIPPRHAAAIKAGFLPPDLETVGVPVGITNPAPVTTPTTPPSTSPTPEPTLAQRPPPIVYFGSAVAPLAAGPTPSADTWQTAVPLGTISAPKAVITGQYGATGNQQDVDWFAWQVPWQVNFVPNTAIADVQVNFLKKSPTDREPVLIPAGNRVLSASDIYYLKVIQLNPSTSGPYTITLDLPRAVENIGTLVDATGRENPIRRNFDLGYAEVRTYQFRVESPRWVNLTGSDLLSLSVTALNGKQIPVPNGGNVYQAYLDPGDYLVDVKLASWPFTNFTARSRATLSIRASSDTDAAPALEFQFANGTVRSNPITINDSLWIGSSANGYAMAGYPQIPQNQWQDQPDVDSRTIEVTEDTFVTASTATQNLQLQMIEPNGNVINPGHSSESNTSSLTSAGGLPGQVRSQTWLLQPGKSYTLKMYEQAAPNVRDYSVTVTAFRRFDIDQSIPNKISGHVRAADGRELPLYFRTFDGTRIDATKPSVFVIHGLGDSEAGMASTAVAVRNAARNAPTADQAYFQSGIQTLVVDFRDAVNVPLVNWPNTRGHAWLASVGDWLGHTVGKLKMSPDRVNIVGHSWGAWAGYHFAKSLDKKVNSFVALDAAADATDIRELELPAILTSLAAPFLGGGYNNGGVNLKDVAKFSLAIYTSEFGSRRISGTADLSIRAVVPGSEILPANFINLGSILAQKPLLPAGSAIDAHLAARNIFQRLLTDSLLTDPLTGSKVTLRKILDRTASIGSGKLPQFPNFDAFLSVSGRAPDYVFTSLQYRNSRGVAVRESVIAPIDNVRQFVDAADYDRVASPQTTLPVSSVPITRNGWVGAANTKDTFRIVITRPTFLTISLNGLRANDGTALNSQASAQLFRGDNTVPRKFDLLNGLMGLNSSTVSMGGSGVSYVPPGTYWVTISRPSDDKLFDHPYSLTVRI